MARLVSNVKFKYPIDDGSHITMRTPKVSTTIGRGDLLIEDTNTVTQMTAAAAQNLTFVGLAYDHSESTSVMKIKVIDRAVVTLDLAAAAYVWGDRLKYSAGSNTVDWKLEAATNGADGTANFFEEGRTLAAIGEATVLFDIQIMGAGIGYTAAFEGAVA